MLHKIISFSLKNKLIIGLCTMGLIGFGIFELFHLPIDAVPDITNNQVQVITTSPALGAPDVERLITFPIEQVNNNIPGIIEMRSFSRFGLSVVTLVFDDKTDIYWARQQVSERLQQVQNQIPSEIGTPVLAPVTTGLGEVYQYTVHAEKGYEKKYNAMDLRTIQDWIIRKQLLGVKGVAEISSFGGLLKQYEIAIVPEKLLAYNISISDVFEALKNNNQNTGGSYIEKGPTVLFIRSEGLVENLADIENSVIKNLPNGIPLLIRDVAEVKFGNAPRYGALTYNGNSNISGAVVMMLKGANSNEVVQNIKERIEQIKKTLPKGVVIDPFLDRTKMVNNAISTVSKNLIEGALIVIFVLVLFLSNFRAGLIVASVIPLSMLFAIILMNTFGVSGNLMSLGALDFGLIVDGAVIIVEAVMFKIYHSNLTNEKLELSQKELDNEVQNTASSMMKSAVFGQIIILMVYLPIFALQGIEGKMFKPMAQTVAFALIGAFILSLTYIPMMTSVFLKKKLNQKESFSDRLMHILINFYQKNLIKALHHQKVILLIILGLFVSSIFMLTKMGGEFIPSLPEGDFAVETRVLPGSNLTTSTEAVAKASKILLSKFPEVEKVVGKTGSSEVPTDPMPMEASDMMIILKHRNEWKSASTYSELETKMLKELEAIPGVTFGFQYPVAMRFNELISGARQDVVCKIFGENLDTLAHYANKVGEISKSVDGSEALYVETVTGVPEIVIQYNRTAIAQYGLSIRNVNQVVNAAFAGATSGIVYEEEKRFDLVVRLAGEKRKNIENVQQLLINTPAGNQIPLSTVATVKIIEGPNQIQRENSQRRILVGFNVRNRDVQSTVKELQHKIEQKIKLPPGYFVTYGGAFENLEAAKNRLYIAVPVSLILIFILLYFTFHSIKQGLLIYTAIPLSAIGGILALSIRGIDFSVSAGIGFIALFGVAVLNGIVLLAEFNNLKKSGMNNLKRIVLTGTKSRLRPVLMTALVASLGFLPMALSHGEGAEVQRPLATVVIGGLLVATFLTLIVLPILYLNFNQENKKHKKPSQKLLIVVFLLIGVASTNGQTITLKQAIDTAISNNLTVKNERLKSEYQKKLIQSGIAISPTTLNGEYGQINSFYKDVRIGVSQNLQFPTVYASQKKLLNEEWKASILNVGLQESNLKKRVAETFYEIIYLEKKQQLLSQNDSLYSEFIKQADFRFQQGESNQLEKSSAEIQRSQILVQLNQLRWDLELAKLEFQLLLNTTIFYNPLEQNNDWNALLLNDNNQLEAHPSLQLLKQNQQVAQAMTRVERSKLIPDFTVGYNIMSMKGRGSDEILYNSQLRFQSVQLGIGVPIFVNSQRAKIQAAKINEKIAQQDYELTFQKMETELNMAINQFEKYQETLNFFENNSLKNAMSIEKTAADQLKSGEINFLEWMLLINQSVEVKSNYLDAFKNRNIAGSQLIYYVNFNK